MRAGVGGGRGAKAMMAAAAAAVAAGLVNNRPIIGILTLPNDNPAYPQYRSYFPASYVKWLESGGARVVPLPYTTPLPQLASMLTNLNGAFFTGGGADFTNPDGTLTQFATAAQLIFNASVTAWGNGEPWPLWGTCLGHELISFLASGCNASTVTSGFNSENVSFPVYFTAAAPSSRMWGFMPADVIATYANYNITINNHQSGVTPADFTAAPSLANRFTVLSTNVDLNGRPFVSSMEGQGGLPIFTTQFHPEKVQFEWWALEAINHTFPSLVANHLLSLFFINQTRSNGRAFPSPNAESAALIYNYNPEYTAPNDPSFEQCYFFD